MLVPLLGQPGAGSRETTNIQPVVRKDVPHLHEEESTMYNRIKEAKDDILNCLFTGKAFTAAELSRAAYLNETSDGSGTFPVARKAIRSLIDDGYVIGSSISGYKMLTTGKEVQVYLNALLKRQMGISARIQAVYDSAQNKGLL